MGSNNYDNYGVCFTINNENNKLIEELKEISLVNFPAYKQQKKGIKYYLKWIKRKIKKLFNIILEVEVSLYCKELDEDEVYDSLDENY